MRILADHAGAVRVSGGDPWVRFGVDPGRPLRAWHDPASGLLAVAPRRPRAGRVDLVLLTPASGDPEGALAGLRRLATSEQVTSVTVPRALAAAAPRVLALAPEAGAEWDWMWTDGPPTPQPGEDDVHDLDAADPVLAAELTGLLTTHSPRHSATPGSPGVQGWVGVRRDGLTLACAAWFEPVPGIPLLASVAVRPEARRSGLAGAVTGTITRRALAAGSPAVTVDLYADNDAARRVYERLGFRTAHAFTSWSLPAPPR
jgi:GNAT superfamily N-acetyltransferase